MPISVRFCLLCGVILLGACVSRNAARQEPGLSTTAGENIPAATPGPGWERVEKRPDATPTPSRTSNPMDRPLDPTGFPVTPTPHG
jgi:hypothetical protein